ncbi:MAG: hypothetical protein QM764_09255 [Chitinophagaceae bacterium]
MNLAPLHYPGNIQYTIVLACFSYYNGEVDFDHCTFIKLENNYYISENNSGPVGLTDIDLIILDEKECIERTKELKEIEIDVRSLL